eukprot:7146517-Pyramimonas_sp.AAC.1
MKRNFKSFAERVSQMQPRGSKRTAKGPHDAPEGSQTGPTSRSNGPQEAPARLPCPVLPSSY